ncbi:cysteine protease ATG4D-like isoform X1 [Thalassophryne amazonica]|uniref:cysteine protease ATG4D-like isoform X1 n=1 Tax=Thalassophryne amazonica TaxID=390379 RepID=UPI0014710C5B|nr:cysteine protease ATG4D-like isoform X1 [Thalassophryne amazonica]
MYPSASLACSEDQSPTDDNMDDWQFLFSESVESVDVDMSRKAQDAEDQSKFKSKLVSVWNSVKYGWTLKQKSHFNQTSPVFMLGNSYKLSNHEEKESFRRSFASLLWLTYRRGFPRLGSFSLTTDSGWGCVLRTGQMLLAKGLLLHLMPPGWTWSRTYQAVKDDMDLPTTCSAVDADTGWNLEERPKNMGRKLSLGSIMDRPIDARHRSMVSWFADCPAAPFGIHKLVEFGKSSGKKAGDWYGPSIVAHILRKAVAESTDIPNLTVYVAQDCTIFKDDVKKLCERPHSANSGAASQSWMSVIILVPVRLGGEAFNPAYITSVKGLLKLPCCIGIIGGKPKHSLFFVGFQDDHLLYLDPHYCQPTVDTKRDHFPLQSFHCKHPRKMALSRMDPSCTIGFYAKDQKDFEKLCADVNEVVSTSADVYPIFIFAEGHGRYEEETLPTNNITYIQRKNEKRKTKPRNSFDEFVML